MTGPERTDAWALLRSGYGVEDVAVKLRLACEDVRHMVGHMRRTNRLYAQLDTDRARNAEALRIMGVH